ncbi:MAG: response regulator [Nitrospina sp.]|jgi:PAS domain S-box-containing protein|nr:response regulator [Nitrospina sp.]
MDIKQTSGSKGDILVVDDSQDSLKSLEAILTREGYSVRAAPNGQTALMIVTTLPPELILLDVKMPGMDGYEVCRKLKADERTRDIGIIFISALTDLADKVKGFETGGVDYITKPFQYKEVLARVKTHVTFCHMQKALEKARNELEIRIEQRTLELSKTNEKLLAEVSEHRLTEQALRKSSSLLSSIIENQKKIIIFSLDRGYRYTSFNQAHSKEMNKVWGVNIEMGNRILDYIPGDEDREMAEKNYERVIRGEAFTSIEEYGEQGNRFCYELTYNPIIEEENNVVGLTLFITDVTDRKRAEDELNMHKDHLEELVGERTVELEEKNAELERMNDLFVGREFRIKELRERVKELERSLTYA